MSEEKSTPPASAERDRLLLEVADALRTVSHGYARREASNQVWTWVKRVVLAAVFVAGVAMWLATYGGLFGLRPAAVTASVAVVSISGEISDASPTTASRVVPLLREACSDDHIKAVILKISSPGGSPSHAERIAQALEYCRGEKPKRVVAVIDGLGASAAYLIAVHADAIVANRYALIGSLGAVTSRFELSAALAKVGVTEQTYASGIYKSMLSPWRPDTPAQAALARAMVDRIAGLFRATVVERRGARLVADPDLWSGRLWVADDAIKLGLIDEVAVLEPYVEREFGDLPLHYMSPKRTLAERFGAQSMLDALADRVVARLSDPEIR